MGKVVEDEYVETEVEREGKEALEAESTFGASWRIMLFRAVRDNNIPLMERVCESQPAAIHENFTSGMKEWELQWDSLRWYEFADATALYVASSYSADKVVEWLLQNGVDPDTVCYASLKAINVIGQCDYKQEAAAKIERLLKAPREPPQPPIVPTLFAKIGYEDHMKTVYEEVVNPEDPDGALLKRAKRVSETVVRCKISATYKSYWLPPKTNYELRMRAAKSPEWKIERTQATHKIVTGLLPGTVYEVQVRAKNVAGWSDFTEVKTIKTPDAKVEKVEEDEVSEEEQQRREEEQKKKEEEDRKARRRASIL
jgi:hypothetical protein